MNEEVFALVRELESEMVVYVEDDYPDVVLSFPSGSSVVIYNDGDWADLLDSFGRVSDFEDETADVFDAVRRWARWLSV